MRGVGGVGGGRGVGGGQQLRLLVLELSKSVRVGVEGGKEHSLLIVSQAQDLVVQQVELVTHTEPGGEQVLTGINR